MSEESQIESREHQDDADIDDQPFPESVPEEREIDADDNGDHRQHVKRDGNLSSHFSLEGAPHVGGDILSPTP